MNARLVKLVNTSDLINDFELHFSKDYVAYTLKFGETFKMAIPSQASMEEGVET